MDGLGEGSVAQFRSHLRRRDAVTPRVILAVVVVVSLANGPVRAAQNSTARELVRRECSACHGPHGISVTPRFPHLAGQQAQYLEAQLKAFRDRSRADPYAQAFMWGMAAQLSDGTIAEIAAYYAGQRPAPGETARPAEVDAGRKIYEEGIPAQQVAPCQVCHRRHAEGAGVIPRLADQHREYLEKQLKYFVAGLRADPTMRASVGNLTARQIGQVAAFLGSPDNGRPTAATHDRPTEKSSRIAVPPAGAKVTSHEAIGGAGTVSRPVRHLVLAGVAGARSGQTTPRCVVVRDTTAAVEEIDEKGAARTARRR
jgi:cytochrome c553